MDQITQKEDDYYNCQSTYSQILPEDILDVFTNELLEANNQKLNNINAQDHKQDNDNDEDDEFCINYNFLEIRKYQQKLYDEAKKENSILYLETGTGKTLITVMLIWHYLCKESDKKVVFLANNIQLIEQQGKYIQKNLRMIAQQLEDELNVQYTKKKLSIIHGNKFPDHWNLIKWKNISQSYDIFVVTAQVFLNFLRRGYFLMKNISLLVFDECHAAISKHQYNNIFREFYFPMKFNEQIHQLPRIIDSRSIDKKIIYKDLLQLAANLDATYAFVDQQQIKEYLKEAKVQFVEYHTQSSIYKFLEFTKNQHIQNLEFISQTDYPEFYEILKFLTQLLEQFREQGNEQKIDYIQQTITFLQTKGVIVILELGSIALIKIIDQIIDALEEIPITRDFFKMKNKNFYTDKLMKLFEILKLQSQTQNNMGLIFVKIKIMARILTKVLEELFNTFNNEFKINFIVGQTSSQEFQEQNKKKRLQEKEIKEKIKVKNEDEREVKINEIIKEMMQKDFSNTFYQSQKITKKLYKDNMKQEVQNIILTKFREGVFNVRIVLNMIFKVTYCDQCSRRGDRYTKLQLCYRFQSNKIIEDVCIDERTSKKRKFLIFYINTFQNSTQYYKIFIEKLEKQKSQAHQKVIQYTKESILSLKEIKEKFQDVKEKIQKQQLELYYLQQIYIDQSQATLNTNWSMEVIHLFCRSIKMENNMRAKPSYSIYEFQMTEKLRNKTSFIAILMLPIQLKSFIFCGEHQALPENAKSSVAFKAAQQLYQDGYLMDNFKPCYQSDFGNHLGADDEDGNVEQSLQLQNITKKYSKIIMAKQMIGQIEISNKKKCYLQLNNEFFQCERELDYKFVGYIFMFNKIEYFLICSDKQTYFEQALGLIQDNINGNFIILEKIEISIEDYNQYFLRYQKFIIQIYNLLQRTNDTYLNDLGTFHFINKPTEFCIQNHQEINQKNSDFFEIMYEIIFGLKVYTLSQKVGQLFTSINLESQLQFINNEILGNHTKYQEFIAIDNQKNLKKIKKLTNSPQLKINFDQSSFQNDIPLQLNQVIEEVLQQSLNINNFNPMDLLQGKLIYQLVTTLNNKNMQQDLQIFIANSKRYFSNTYIRNHLIENLKIFSYTQFNINKDQYKLIPGLILELPNKSLQVNHFESFLDFYINSISFENIPPYYEFISSSTFSDILYQILQCCYEYEEDLSLSTQFLQTIQIIDPQRERYQYVDQNIEIPFKQLYDPLIRIIGHEFKTFTYLFQALTDISIKNPIVNVRINQQQFILQLISPNIESLFSKQKSMKFVFDTDFFINQFQKMNGMNNYQFSNDYFASIGKYLWKLCLFNYLKKQKYSFLEITTALKYLTQQNVLSQLSIKMNYHLYLNTDDYTKIHQIAEFYKKRQYNLIKSKDGAVLKLAKAFQAVLAAIFFDSGQNLTYLNNLLETNIFLYIHPFIKVDNIRQNRRYQLLEWFNQIHNLYFRYENTFQKEAWYFDLIKIPHQDYKEHHEQNLYIPYDNKEAKVINVLITEFDHVQNLQLFAFDKREAWHQLEEKFLRNELRN